MKQQFAITHQHTALQHTEQLDQTLTDQHLSRFFFGKDKTLHIVCGHIVLTGGLFVNKLSSNAGISVSLIVWVMKNGFFVMSDVCSYVLLRKCDI
jgi:hypothetical protein